MLLFTLLQVQLEPKDSLEMAIVQKYQEVTSMSFKEIWQSLLDNFTHWGLKLLAAILLYIVGAWLIRKLRHLLVKVFNKRHFDPSLSSFLTSFVNISLTVILFIMIVTILGVPTSTFTALLAAGGLAIGMALSGTLQNFAGGVMILLFKPFKVGDYIEANGFSGTVKSINITNTHLNTVDNKLVILPNSSCSSGNVVNYSSMPVRRVDWSVTISYGDDVEIAKKTALDLLSKDKRVLTKPDVPFAALSQLGDSALVIVIRAWTKSEDYWPLYFDMNEKIYKEFPKNGLNFPFPQMDVTLKRE